jgi:Tfp pilus assembly protein PilF/peroxiredoxin
MKHLLAPAVLATALTAALAAVPASASGAPDEPDRGRAYFYTPARRLPETLAPILRHLAPGEDAFPEEKDALEVSARLAELSRRLRSEGAAGAAGAVAPLLAPEFKGGRLVPVDAAPLPGREPLEIAPVGKIAPDLVRDRGSFAGEWAGFLSDVQTVHVAEFIVTALEREAPPSAGVRTVVRYDIVGSGADAWRAERIGRWQMRWRRDAAQAWHVVEWTALEDRRSRASAPIFTETTTVALAGDAALRAQLAAGYDAWLSTVDSVFMQDSMGHHGLAAGDVDGDGHDDLYVAQPSALPNRLFRNRGDGTFEDWTARSGLGILDDTSQAILADVDNDGDQDAVVIARAGPLLFTNDGQAHFTRDPEGFRFKSGLRGSATSASMADYDRDGFLDLYLCTYSYFIGASSDKAGPPAPYHDAMNGPPNVLLRNDGRGRFVDVTDEVGLDENNDRFSFASAWGDYDGDGWLDLLVANDFGRKNLYRNGGAAKGPLRFKDVAAAAGVEDHGAGMSAAWLDYDHDGDLDIYTGNMWSAAGLRVTAHPSFLPDASEDIRALYRRHARGNSLFRNNGDGTFADVTLEARAEMGRWAWSSDVLDFDRDGWEDLYIVNGMFTRDAEVQGQDLDSFFWRQVTARSPLTRVTGTSYDDAWRAINRLLVVDGEQAAHERKVFLRNDGRGGFDDVSGTVGLDLDQDGRSFVVLDYDGDGDSDVVTLAARSAPQLRLFRNDHPDGNAALTVRLRGTRSNRDAIGARVTVETEAGRLVRVVQAGSGFISQHSKELLFGLGKSERVAKLTVSWPSGAQQSFPDLPANRRVSIVEGQDAPGLETFRPPSTPAPATTAAPTSAAVVARPPSTTWLYEPFPAPDFTLVDLGGKKASLSALRPRPVALLFWASWAEPSVAALQDLARHQAALTRAGVSVLALSLDAAADEAKVRAAVSGLPLTVAIAGDEVGATYSVLNQYAFVRKENLRLPTLFLLNAAGDVVKAYRDPSAAAQLVADVARIDAAPAERLARALPFKGTFLSAPAERPYLQYALELVEQELESAALPAFERAARQSPNAIAFYSLGTIYMKKGEPVRAKGAFERALELKPDFAEANNSLGALVAQAGNVPGAIARFRAALESKPDYPDALNNLGYALFQTRQRAEAFALYQKALKLQPDFAQAFNNLGIYYAQEGDLARAGEHFRRAVELRPDYGEAATNVALVAMAANDSAGAIRVLQKLLEKDPAFEMAYVTLAKVYLTIGQPRQGVQVLEQLLQRNPSHPMALDMVRQLKAQAR